MSDRTPALILGEITDGGEALIAAKRHTLGFDAWLWHDDAPRILTALAEGQRVVALTPVQWGTVEGALIDAAAECHDLGYLGAERATDAVLEAIRAQLAAGGEE